MAEGSWHSDRCRTGLRLRQYSDRASIRYGQDLDAATIGLTKDLLGHLQEYSRVRWLFWSLQRSYGRWSWDRNPKGVCYVSIRTVLHKVVTTQLIPNAKLDHVADCSRWVLRWQYPCADRVSFRVFQSAPHVW